MSAGQGLPEPARNPPPETRAKSPPEIRAKPPKLIVASQEAEFMKGMEFSVPNLCARMLRETLSGRWAALGHRVRKFSSHLVFYWVSFPRCEIGSGKLQKVAA